MKKAFFIKVIGDVQGVSYRYSAIKEAQKFELSGWVKNDLGGGVSAVIQGEGELCDKFIEWTNEGSPMAEVEKVDVEEIEVDEGIKGFGVK